MNGSKLIAGKGGESLKRARILSSLAKVMAAHSSGLLGGEQMPEDAAPRFEDSDEMLAFFTLPMSLNYQRNSYALWESARRMYDDPEGRRLFNVEYVAKCEMDDLREVLVKWRVALQPNRHPEIYSRVARGFFGTGGGTVAGLLRDHDYSVVAIEATVRSSRKKEFPYLSGPKIFNYWLYVLEQYCNITFVDRSEITVAPDTHVIQASHRLGVLSDDEASRQDVAGLLAERWKDVLSSQPIDPIDIHTPLWLWSRAGMPRFD
jgi:hypothetical protein